MIQWNIRTAQHLRVTIRSNILLSLRVMILDKRYEYYLHWSTLKGLNDSKDVEVPHKILYKEASYRVSYRIAQQGEAHTIAESLIKPCVKDVVTSMIGEVHAKSIDCVLLSDTTISRRVKGISNFCDYELIRRLKAYEHGFTIQLDETTDIAGLSILLVIVRYIQGTVAQENMLICKSLPTRITVEEIFNIVNSYFKKHDIYWVLYHQACTNGERQCFKAKD
ncbi:zinc finger BED domain-containing protein 5 [Nephila pilipes]|uniref:Zinc finger BED domain-containing protein 5 n=1 Tax=Nephila pilipes TaxID=299642 RepID=A0A8X6TZ79_NEPPI|nr:zinc finger BED domain-containing protein 5 [Nephila pilipes]